MSMQKKEPGMNAGLNEEKGNMPRSIETLVHPRLRSKLRERWKESQRDVFEQLASRIRHEVVDREKQGELKCDYSVRRSIGRAAMRATIIAVDHKIYVSIVRFRFKRSFGWIPLFKHALFDVDVAPTESVIDFDEDDDGWKLMHSGELPLLRLGTLQRRRHDEEFEGRVAPGWHAGGAVAMVAPWIVGDPFDFTGLADELRELGRSLDPLGPVRQLLSVDGLIGSGRLVQWPRAVLEGPLGPLIGSQAVAALSGALLQSDLAECGYTLRLISPAGGVSLWFRPSPPRLRFIPLRKPQPIVQQPIAKPLVAAIPPRAGWLLPGLESAWSSPLATSMCGRLAREVPERAWDAGAAANAWVSHPLF